MNRRICTLTLAALCATVASPSFAQQGYGNANGNQNGNAGALNLPDGVRNVVGIDAQNVLLAEMEPETPNGPRQYRAIPVRHVYVGGIAKALGGDVISTEEFVSPAFSNNGGFGGINPQGSFGGAQGFGQNQFGNGFGPTFGNGFGNGFGSPGFGNGFNNGGFPGGGFPGGGFVGVPGLPPGALPGVRPGVTYGMGNLVGGRRVQNNGGTVTTQESR